MSDNLKKLRILCVEDEINLARLIREAIGPYFREFILAHDGREGLKIFQTQRPDLVITDITMPHMDGLAMSRKIRELSPETPIVVLSAYSDTEKLLRAIDTGIVKYFIKPFDPEELLEYLLELTARTHSTLPVSILPDYRYDPSRQILYRSGSPLSLSVRELAFLEAMLNEPGHLLAVPAIKKLLWPDEEATDDAVRVFVNRLRRKAGRELIRNRSGEGYFLAVRQE